LLDALGHMITPSKITRRIARRPYFPQARLLFDLLAAVMGADAVALDRFLSTPVEHAGGRGGRRLRRHAAGPHAGAAADNGSGRRPRRRRRGGRRRNRRRFGDAARSEGAASDVRNTTPQPIDVPEPESQNLAGSLNGGALRRDD
jgi:hypothetical protein